MRTWTPEQELAAVEHDTQSGQDLDNIMANLAHHTSRQVLRHMMRGFGHMELEQKPDAARWIQANVTTADLIDEFGVVDHGAIVSHLAKILASEAPMADVRFSEVEID